MSCFGGGNKGDKLNEYVRPHGQWNTYACGCCENCGNCCCCLFFCPCVMADLYHYTWSLPWWLALVSGIVLLPFHMILVMLVRSRVRWKHKLEGNLISDVICLLFCCWPLVVCQLRDQIHYLRRRREWKLGYAQEFGDIPPWIKPCLRLRDLIEKRTKKNTKSIDGESTARTKTGAATDSGESSAQQSDSSEEDNSDHESDQKEKDDADDDDDDADADDDDDDDDDDRDTGDRDSSSSEGAKQIKSQKRGK